MSKEFYQLAEGIWNPAKDNHSWVVVEEFDTLREAREAMDNHIAAALDLGRMARVTNEHREAYGGNPMAILKIRSQIVGRVEGKKPVTA